MELRPIYIAQIHDYFLTRELREDERVWVQCDSAELAWEFPHESAAYSAVLEFMGRHVEVSSNHGATFVRRRTTGHNWVPWGYYGFKLEPIQPVVGFPKASEELEFVDTEFPGGHQIARFHDTLSAMKAAVFPWKLVARAPRILRMSSSEIEWYRRIYLQLVGSPILLTPESYSELALKHMAEWRRRFGGVVG